MLGCLALDDDFSFHQQVELQGSAQTYIFVLDRQDHLTLDLKSSLRQFPGKRLLVACLKQAGPTKRTMYFNGTTNDLVADLVLMNGMGRSLCCRTAHEFDAFPIRSFLCCSLFCLCRLCASASGSYSEPPSVS